MITRRKISAVEEMAVAAAEALKQEKVLAKAMKKGGKPSYPGNVNLNLNTKDMKESKDKHELKGVKISDSDELRNMVDSKGSVSVPGSVPVHVAALSLALRATSTTGDDTTPATAYATAYAAETVTGDGSGDKMNINNTEYLSTAEGTADSSVTHLDTMSSHDRDTRTALSSLIPGLGLGPRSSAAALTVSVEDMVTGPGMEGTASGGGDGLTLPLAPHAQENAIENVLEKRSSRVRVPKRMFEEASSMQNSEESVPIPDSADDVTVPRGVVDGVKSAGSLLVELEEPDEEEERAGLCVVLPSELTPNPDPSSFLPCMVYSLPCEDAFYACCMDQVSAVMLCYGMLCHNMPCDCIWCLVTSCFSSYSSLDLKHMHTRTRSLSLTVSYSLKHIHTHTQTHAHTHTHTHSLTVPTVSPSA
jgi:hypothetical protein